MPFRLTEVSGSLVELSCCIAVLLNGNQSPLAGETNPRRLEIATAHISPTPRVKKGAEWNGTIVFSKGPSKLSRGFKGISLGWNPRGQPATLHSWWPRASQRANVSLKPLFSDWWGWKRCQRWRPCFTLHVDRVLKGLVSLADCSGRMSTASWPPFFCKGLS